MPKTEGVPHEEATEIEREIKAHLAGAGSNINDVVKRLNEEYGTAETSSAVVRQLKRGTIPFWKVLRMAAVLGYELIWKKREG
jgi:hypothetical protein